MDMWEAYNAVGAARSTAELDQVVERVRLENGEEAAQEVAEAGAPRRCVLVHMAEEEVAN